MYVFTRMNINIYNIYNMYKYRHIYVMSLNEVMRFVEVMFPHKSTYTHYITEKPSQVWEPSL